MSALRFAGVRKRFPGFEMGPVDLVVPTGLVTGLIGANGAGKTTLIKMALGLMHPDEGRIESPQHEHIGVVYDVPALIGDWRVTQVAAAIAPFYPQWDAAEFERIVAWAGVDPGKKVKDLSRGMGMKLQLAVAMAHGADLLILDEPTSGLDPLARRELLDMVADFMTDESHSVLFSTHITTDLENIADHLALLRDGRLLMSGPMPELIDGYRFVRGRAADLPTVHDLVHGLRRHSAGWEGLMRTEDTASLPPGAAVAEPTLEQLLIHLAKEDSHV